MNPVQPLLHAGHYENFPVASILLPRRLRAPIRTIYAFVRRADDLADEGELTPAERHASLSALRADLHRIEQGEAPSDASLNALAHVLKQHELPTRALHDLLDAFTQDIDKTRYADFGEVMAYCRKSANPVGRLLLSLYGDSDPRHQALSDGLCSALQLINFLQDIAIDYRKGRIYLPQDDLARFGISERQIAEGRVDALWQQFMKTQIERARKMLQASAPLGLALRGRIGLETRMIILGGGAILEKLHEARGDVFTRRPVLTGRDWLSILRGALWPQRRQTGSSQCSTGCRH